MDLRGGVGMELEGGGALRVVQMLERGIKSFRRWRWKGAYGAPA